MLSELTGGRLTTTELLGGEVLPEESVVNVSTVFSRQVLIRGVRWVEGGKEVGKVIPAMELQHLLKRNLGLNVVGMLGLGILGLGLVQAVDVSLVMLRVVKLGVPLARDRLYLVFASSSNSWEWRKWDEIKRTSMILPEMEGSSSA